MCVFARARHSRSVRHFPTTDPGLVGPQPPPQSHRSGAAVHDVQTKVLAARFLASYFVDSRDPRAAVRKKASGAAYAGDHLADLGPLE